MFWLSRNTLCGSPRDRVAPGIGPSVDALVAAARRRLIG
jgi:hypothetical protein